MGALMTTTFAHRDYLKYAPKWKLIKDVVSGKDDVDAAGETYLPKPLGRTDSEYAAYQKRAVLYNTTARTLDGLLGALFRKKPKIYLPETVKYLEDDCDGQGNSLEQFAKEVALNTISVNRYGILVDFPQAKGVSNLAEERKLNLTAHLCAYSAESILYWRTKRVGSKEILTLVVLEEKTFDEIGLFSEEENTSYRVLRLDSEGRYVNEIYQETEVKDKNGRVTTDLIQTSETIMPLMPGEKPLNYIPFYIVGGVSPTKPPMYDLARLNLSHYINSADYEESIFMIGQPTPWIAGLSDTFIENNKGDLRIGSRAAWLLPEGTTVGLLESKAEKSYILKAMEQKESQMVGIGARILLDNSSRGSESVESVQLRRSGEASLLACMADDISRILSKALSVAAKWMGTEEEAVVLLNKDFFSERISHQDINSLVAAWQSNAISHSVLLDNLRRGEVIAENVEDEEIIGELESQGLDLGMLGEADGDEGSTSGST